MADLDIEEKEGEENTEEGTEEGADKGETEEEAKDEVRLSFDRGNIERRLQNINQPKNW